MHTLLIFIFLAFIPALVVLGHDAYLFYPNQDAGFQFSTLGFLWTKYSAPTYEQVLLSLSEGDAEIFAAILGRKAIELAAAFGVVLSCLAIVIKLIFVLFSGLNHMNQQSKMRRH